MQERPKLGQKSKNGHFFARTPTKYLNSYIFRNVSSRRYRKGRTLDRTSQLHLGPLQHHCVLSSSGHHIFQRRSFVFETIILYSLSLPPCCDQDGSGIGLEFLIWVIWALFDPISTQLVCTIAVRGENTCVTWRDTRKEHTRTFGVYPRLVL